MRETTDSAKVRSWVTERGLEHEFIPIDPSFGDTAAFCEKYGFPIESSANAILVASKRPAGKACVCLVLATQRLDVNKRVCELLGVKRASFAKAEQMREITGMEVGGVTPFGLPEGIPLYIDPAVMKCEWVIVGAGSRDAKFKVSPAVFEKIPGFKAVSIAD